MKLQIRNKTYFFKIAVFVRSKICIKIKPLFGIIFFLQTVPSSRANVGCIVDIVDFNVVVIVVIVVDVVVEMSFTAKLQKVDLKTWWASENQEL